MFIACIRTHVASPVYNSVSYGYCKSIKGKVIMQLESDLFSSKLISPNIKDCKLFLSAESIND